MRLREWDPGVAPDAELASWLRAYNSALAADLPRDPPWGPDRLRDYLTVTMPRERRLTWLAEEPRTVVPSSPPPAVGDQPPAPRDQSPSLSDEAVETEVVGYGRLLMLNGLGVIELFVAPPGRRRGVGSALLATVAARAVEEGFTTLGIEVAGGTPAATFYAAHGFRHAFTEMRSILNLTTVDWSHVAEMAAGVVQGYHLEYHPGGLPEEILPAYARAKQVRRLDPGGELELRPSSYDPDRLRASIQCLRGRGLMPYIVIAIHNRTETVAALTELVVPAQHPTRADQYDTIVVPEHNSYGLARAIKARMLVELHRDEPQLRKVQTWHATEREQLEQVNRELGFTPDREWREYEVDARDLLKRLHP